MNNEGEWLYLPLVFLLPLIVSVTLHTAARSSFFKDGWDAGQASRPSRFISSYNTNMPHTQVQQEPNERYVYVILQTPLMKGMM